MDPHLQPQAQQPRQPDHPQDQHHQSQHPQQHQQAKNGPVHCFWALMTYGDLRFIYLSSSVQRAVSAKYKQLLGQSFFDYIHPDEAKLARKDLNAFMDVHNLYGSVTRCRFKNVCPEWQQRRQARPAKSAVPASVSAAALQAAATEGGLSSRGLGLGGFQPQGTDDTSGLPKSPSNSQAGSLEQGIETVLSLEARTSPGRDNDCKDYEDIFQNGDDDFMILDVVMNVVSDEVVLGFFHIDGQGLYKGFWSNGICGESEDSLATLAPEILRHLKDSAQAKDLQESANHTSSSTVDDNRTSPPSSPNRRGPDQKTKRIFQLYDTQQRNLLLTWPEPGRQADDSGTIVYNPELYTHIVKSHHIPADALENTTCLKRFCSKHALPNIGQSTQEHSYQVESVFIPYGHIIFACFQTSLATPTNRWSSVGSPLTSTATANQGLISSGRAFSSLGGGSVNDQLSGLGLALPSSSPGAMRSTPFTVGGSPGTSSAINSPVVIPSLPSLSPYIKHTISPMGGSAGSGSGLSSGVARGSPGSNAHPSLFHPYARSSGFSASSSASSSPSALPLPESMQESLSFLNDYKVGEQERSGRTPNSLGDSQSHSQSNWHASTHPAIQAMVNHALAPSSPSFQRTVSNDSNSTRPLTSFNRSIATTGSHHSQSLLGAPLEIPNSKDSRSRKLSSSPRHPALDAAMRKKSSPTPTSNRPLASSTSPPLTHPALDVETNRSLLQGHGHPQGSLAKTSSSAGPSTSSHGGLVIRIHQEEKACESCHTTNSPEWRRGPSGKKDLCNACGLRYSRSVARQNRQAQKQLEGKVAKVKPPKGTTGSTGAESGPKTSKSGSKKSMEHHPPSTADGQPTSHSYPSAPYQPFPFNTTHTQMMP